MPISYRIDREQNLVRTTAGGVLSDEDVLSHKRALDNAPAFAVGMRELLTEKNVPHVGVFKSYEDAATWLGIGVPDA